MIPEENLRISFKELALRGQQVLAQQPKISYEEALAQVQWLKEISKVNQSLKKNRLVNSVVIHSGASVRRIQ